MPLMTSMLKDSQVYGVQVKIMVCAMSVYLGAARRRMEEYKDILVLVKAFKQRS